MAKGKTFFDKPSRKGKKTNIPLGETGHQSSGRAGSLTKDGLVYRNDLLKSDYTSQNPMRKKSRIV